MLDSYFLFFENDFSHSARYFMGRSGLLVYKLANPLAITLPISSFCKYFNAS